MSGCKYSPSAISNALRYLMFYALAYCCSSTAHAQRTIRVPQDASSIQSAIDAATDGDTVLVSPGTYTVSLDFKGKAITVTTGATDYTQPVVSQTVLQASAVPIAVFYRGEGRRTVLNGFTITDPVQPYYTMTAPGESASTISAVLDSFAGYGRGTDFANPLNPANASPTITNNRFIDDVSAINLSGAEVAHNYFSRCSGETVISLAVFEGVDPGPRPAVHDNIFENNSGQIVGGFGLIYNNVFSNNNGSHTSEYARVLALIGSNSLFVNNLAYDNHYDTLLHVVGEFGPPKVLVANNTFAVNSPSSDCQKDCSLAQLELGQTASFAGNAVTLSNNIFQTSSPGSAVVCDDAPDSPQQDTFQLDHNLFSVAGPEFDASCRSQIVTAGNKTGDPLFRSPSTNDYHPAMNSPAVDSGNNSVLEQGALLGGSLTSDLDGNPRPLDSLGNGYPIIDLGAYEFAGLSDGRPTGLSLTPSTYFPFITQSVALTASLSSSLGVPVGPVTFYENGEAISTQPVDSTGQAKVVVPFTAVGGVEFIASYPGANPFSPAVSTKLVLEVQQFSTYINLTATPTTANPGQPVALQVSTGSGDPMYVPSPISLTVNGTPFATLLPDAAGHASVISSTLPVGVDTIVARYTGDSFHKASSATATVSIVLDDFSITVNPPILTLSSGGQGQVAVSLQSLGVFADALQLSIADVPQYGSAAFNPASVQLSAGSSASSHLTILTSTLPRQASLHRNQPGGSRSIPITCALLGSFPWLLRHGRKRKPARSVGAALLFAALCCGFIGCTNISYPLNQVAPGTYVLPITATDPSTGVSHSVNLTLVVT